MVLLSRFQNRKIKYTKISFYNYGIQYYTLTSDPVVDLTSINDISTKSTYKDAIINGNSTYTDEIFYKTQFFYPDLSINAQDCNGYTALIKCARRRWDRRNEGKKCDWYEKIYYFLKDEMHADTLIRDRNNRTAQDWWDMPLDSDEEEDENKYDMYIYK